MSLAAPDPQVDQASQRLVGIAALRQLRRLVDAENEQEKRKAVWAKRLLAVTGCTLIGVILMFIFQR